MVETVFLRILNMSITASFLLAAVMLLRFLTMKKVPKRIFCVFWAFAAVRLVCPVSVESPLSLIPDTPLVTERGFLGAEQRGPARGRVQGIPASMIDAEETEAGTDSVEAYGETSVVNAAGNGQVKEKTECSF